MSDNNKDVININVIIADRPYPLKIKKEEEEEVRKAAKAINDKVMQFQQVYAAKDKQDYLAMCALMYAVQNIESKKNTNSENSSLYAQIEELESLLSI
ncbi:MAG: cell division protein ZapA [Chitinophagales bacterium]|nr:cell division protein ZapA [Bacteroidota bacterium]MCB9227065.1 cell division protein ZapA [Chitinophagales bacterium]